MLPTAGALLLLHVVLGWIRPVKLLYTQHLLDQDSAAENVEQEHQQATQTRSCHRIPPDFIADVDLQKLVALQLQQCKFAELVPMG